MMTETEKFSNRADLLSHLLDSIRPEYALEIGVWRGDFSIMALRKNYLKKLWMMDPWRELSDWRKPFNVSNEEFEKVYQVALKRTEFAAAKRVVLRGTTTEKIGEIKDGILDFAYVDGDHTLRGVTIDLVSVWDKVRPGGWIVGDDFVPSIWQHSKEYEPTLVFPFACYFAEAKGCKIYSLGNRQFAIQKPRNDQTSIYSFHDHSSTFKKLQLIDHFS